MKQLLLTLLAVLFATSIHAQGEVRIDTVIQIPTLTKQQIYQNAKIWFLHQAYKDGNNTLQFDDKDGGILFGRLNHDFTINNATTELIKKVSWIPYIGKKAKTVQDITSMAGLSGNLTSSVEVRIKDGKCKISMSNISHSSNTDVNLGVIFKDIPSKLSGLQKKQYEAMLSYAFPIINIWWEEILNEFSNMLNQKASEEDW